MLAIVAMLGSNRAVGAEEEPEFHVVHRGDGFEVRLYKPYLVAETTTTGSEREASAAGFRILASYIFGNNTAARRMEMTTPVTTRPGTGGERMAMTTPVTMRKSGDNAHTMRFVMERKYTKETLPKPRDSRVLIIAIPSRTVAVLRYSGPTTGDLFRDKRDRLLERLSASGIEPVAQPVKAVFNGPWTPDAIRRNEVQVEVRWPRR